MGHKYIKTPSGKFRVWSTVVDNWITDEMALEELQDWDLVERMHQATREHKRFWDQCVWGAYQLRLEVNDDNYKSLEHLRKVVHEDDENG
jgi:hypothetical protein